jgi:hypothetical protein
MDKNTIVFIAKHRSTVFPHHLSPLSYLSFNRKHPAVMLWLESLLLELL